VLHWVMANTRISQETRARMFAAWEGILGKVADGALVGKTLESAGFSREMLRAFLYDPERKKEWDTARELSADAFFDQAQEIANSCDADPKAARVRLQALMWLASKRNPRVYSEKAQLDINVRTLDLTPIISAANARLAASRVPMVIEGVSTRLSEELASLL